MKGILKKTLKITALCLIAVFFTLGTGLLFGEQTAHALPEFATRTGEACATCHVNPGGGGPRTLRGLLWASQGQPDLVPILGEILIAPGVTDGLELYDIACSGCHGLEGEGLFGGELVGTGLQENKIRSTILRGRERSGMPGFEDQLTEDQLEILMRFVAGIASGEIPPPSQEYPLAPAAFSCEQNQTIEKCGGN